MIIDVFPINDELEMMRYRLALHEPIALRTLIIESRYTHAGGAKPLHARESLTSEEIARHNIRLLEAPVPAAWARSPRRRPI